MEPGLKGRCMTVAEVARLPVVLREAEPFLYRQKGWIATSGSALHDWFYLSPRSQRMSAQRAGPRPKNAMPAGEHMLDYLLDKSEVVAFVKSSPALLAEFNEFRAKLHVASPGPGPGPGGEPGPGGFSASPSQRLAMPLPLPLLASPAKKKRKSYALDEYAFLDRLPKQHPIGARASQGRRGLLAPILDAGYVAAGDTVTVRYQCHRAAKGQPLRFHGVVSTAGFIEFEGKAFEGPVAFALSCKKSVNPCKKSDHGWNSCFHNDETRLQDYRDALARANALASDIDQEGDEGLDTPVTSPKRSSAKERTPRMTKKQKKKPATARRSMTPEEVALLPVEFKEAYNFFLECKQWVSKTGTGLVDWFYVSPQSRIKDGAPTGIRMQHYCSSKKELCHMLEGSADILVDFNEWRAKQHFVEVQQGEEEEAEAESTLGKGTPAKLGKGPKEHGPPELDEPDEPDEPDERLGQSAENDEPATSPICL